MKRKSFVISAVVLVCIMIRCLSRESPYLVYIVAGINVIAFVYVVFTTFEKALRRTLNKIWESGLPRQICKRKEKKIRFWFKLLGGMALVLFIFTYFMIFCSDLGNDLISILTLGISFMDDDM